MKMQHCPISVTQIYTDNRCVKKVVRSWQFSAAIYPYNTIDRVSTVAGQSRFRCEVMIWCALNALKCRSHSAKDAGITSTLFAQSDNTG